MEPGSESSAMRFARPMSASDCDGSAHSEREMRLSTSSAETRCWLRISAQPAMQAHATP